MIAKDIMTPHPEAVTPADSVQRAAEIMRDLDVGFVPIVVDRDSMRLHGVITDRDIAIRHVAEGHPRACTVGDHMTTARIESVRPDDEVADVLQVMQRRQVRRVPVVDAAGRIVGVIAQADIVVKESPQHAADVAETIGKISEPGHPRR